VPASWVALGVMNGEDGDADPCLSVAADLFPCASPRWVLDMLSKAAIQFGYEFRQFARRDPIGRWRVGGACGPGLPR